MNTSWKPESIEAPIRSVDYRKDLPPSLLDYELPIRILIIKLRHFGDVLLTTPLISTLKINYPHALIDVLVYGGTEVMLASNKNVYLTYTVDRGLKKQGLKKQYRGEKALLNSLKARRYELIINLSEQWRAAFYCYKLHPKFSIGFKVQRRGKYFWKLCHSALVSNDKKCKSHTVINNLSILEPLGLPTYCSKVTMSYNKADIENLEYFCPDVPLSNYIVIQPIARWGFKNWRDEYYSHLIDYLLQRGEKVILTGGKSEEELKHIGKIIEACHNSELIINLAGKLEISELAVLIDRAKLFIGVDSAPMHMAAALQIPSVVLFGPSDLRQWHPWKAPHTLIWAGNYCQLPSPDQVDTNTTERYLDAIPVADVITAVNRRLCFVPPSTTQFIRKTISRLEKSN